MTVRTGVLAVFAVLVMAILPVTAGDGGHAAVPAATAFEPTRVWAVHITIPAKEYEAMQPVTRGLFAWFNAPAAKPTEPGGPIRQVHRNTFNTDLAFAKGDVTVDGHTFAGVGVRYKGNGTISDAAHTAKKSFKIDLGHFGGAGRLHGSKTINLHCGVTDPSKCREPLGYALYRAAGVPAPRTALAEVRLTVPGKFDGELLGVYTAVEPVDKPFLRAHFGTDEGLLMKPEGLREFADLGDNWDKYAKVYAPRREPTPAEAKRVIAFARLVAKGDDEAFRREIESYLDVDAYLRFLAATAFIVNPDSFFNLGHNVYLYLHPGTGRFHFIPWDLDRAFANFFLFGSTAQQMNLSLTQPYPDRHRLTDRLLAMPGVRDRYRSLLADLAATCFARDRLLAEVARLEAATRDPIAREAKAAAGRKETGQGAAATPTFARPPDLKSFVERRTAAAAEQLAGRSPGHVPTAALKLGDLLAEPTLALLDADKDGRLSKAEWVAAAKATFAAGEADGEGRVDQQGLADALNKLYGPEPGRAPAGGPPGGFRPGNMIAGPIMKLAGADRDKKVSLAELVAAAEALFDRFDTGKTGYLDESVFGALLNTLFPTLGGPPPAPKKDEKKP
jgi:spore coat protein H